MSARNAIFIGIKGTVLALDPATGTELWRTALSGSHFVNVTLHGRSVIATTKGEVFALDPASGHVLWNNKLKGLGMGFVTVAGAAQVPGMAYGTQQNDAGAAAAAASS